jgi:hypothetical protein
MRSSKLALVSRLGNVDVNKYIEFKTNEAEKYAELMRELESLGGLTMYIRSWREDIIWVNNFIPGLNPLNVEDLTSLEVNVRKKMLITHNFLKEHVPGFTESYVIDTASQAGVRSSRRLIGEHILTGKDIFSGTVFPDSIAICPDFRFNVSAEHPHWHIPYRSLIPRKIENLLVAGRCFSSDLIANDLLAPIQFCVAMGQAAGTAAAIAVQSGRKPRGVDYRELQVALRNQNVPLPSM